VSTVSGFQFRVASGTCSLGVPRPGPLPLETRNSKLETSSSTAGASTWSSPEPEFHPCANGRPLSRLWSYS